MATILLPLDGSHFAEQAIPHALGRLGPADELYLIQAVEPPPSLMLLETILPEEDMTGSQAYLDGLAERLRTRNFQVRAKLFLGSARETILSVAEREKPALLVVASHGRTGIQRWLLGSVAESVVRMAPCPVWLVRGEQPPEGYDACQQPLPALNRVLVPLDTSERAYGAIEFVIRTVPKAATVILMAATNMQWLATPDALGEVVAQVRAALDERAARLRAEGFTVEVVMDPGTPADAILDNAAARQVDAIMMTSHGRTGAERMFLGSVTEKIVRHSPCPVAVVRG